MVLKINSVESHRRLSSQELLQKIYEGMAAGETSFEINGCGQHDIGGPLWSAEGKPLRFTIKDPGQRVGSMAMDNTEVIVEGPAPADVGWLNAGGTIIVKGDGGDTTAHCAAAGTIYIGGRVGTRSGSLMKHDPKFDPPQFWVLKNTGSFSFEFMGGGIAVVCGHDSEAFESVLGDRACVGMVGGVVYVRGTVKGLSTHDVKMTPLDVADIEFLKAGMTPFLKSIDQTKLEKTLINWNEWQKITPLPYESVHGYKLASISEFRKTEWVAGGIFSDVFPDKGTTLSLVNTSENRLRYPEWENRKACAPCEYACPASIPTQDRYNLIRDGKIQEGLALVYEYSPFPRTVCGEVCPRPCMDSCTRNLIDQSIDMKGLGAAAEMTLVAPVTTKKEKIAIVGAGVAGLSAAWQLRKLGYDVTVYDKDEKIGGKLTNAVSRERLTSGAIEKDFAAFEKIGITYKLGKAVDDKGYAKLKKDYDAVILASGAYQPKLPPWPGKERLLTSVDFLARVNRGEKINVGKKVVVIGAGNTGMDVVFGAYACGANDVIAIDVQKPNAFEKEIRHAESLGCKCVWPCHTQEITEKGVLLNTGECLEADTVIAAIGEAPILDYITDEKNVERGYLKVGNDFHLADNVYSIGDMTKLGLLVDAIGQGREVAFIINGKLSGKPYTPRVKKMIEKNQLGLAYFDRMLPENIEGVTKDVDRCISCGTCRDCRLCKESCPEQAIFRLQLDAKTFQYVSNSEKCIGCSICESVCPCGIWKMYPNKATFPA